MVSVKESEKNKCTAVGEREADCADANQNRTQRNEAYAEKNGRNGMEEMELKQ